MIHLRNLRWHRWCEHRQREFEAKFRFQISLHFDFFNGFDAKRNFEMQAWLGRGGVFAEPLYHADFIGVDGVNG